MYLCARKGEIPISREGLGGRKGNVAVVDCGQTEEKVAREDDGCEPDCLEERGLAMADWGKGGFSCGRLGEEG